MDKQLLNPFTKTVPAVFFAFLLLTDVAAFSQRRVQENRKVAADSTRRQENTASNKLPDVVPVLFGEQDRDNLVQSVGYLSGKKLESAPVTLLSNALAGQMAGLNVTQTTGAPRFDNPDFSLRGRNPLIVIDGVPRYNMVGNGQTLWDQLAINPEQVESVTLLKDALSTVVLGNRAMNGVLMITTRNKSIGNANSIEITAQRGVQTPIGMRKPLGAFDYASLYNEASVNSGFAPLFTPTQLAGYQNGSNPYLYPNVNYQDEVLRKNAMTERYNVSGSGNYTNLKYFFTIDYQHQQGFFKEPADSAEQTNVDFRRYIVRSNIEMKLTKRLTANVNLQANIQDFYQPGVGFAGVFTSLGNVPSNAEPIYNANGTFGGTRNYPTNPYAQSVASGHLQDNLQAAGVDVSVKRELDDVVKGAWVKAAISYSPSYDQQLDRSRNYNAYDVTQNLRVNIISERPNTQSILDRFQQTYVQFSAGIDRQWNKSSLSGLVLTSYENSQENNTLNRIIKNTAARITYSYDKRFNLEAGAAYSGNMRFDPGLRYEFYPAAGASWNIHNEGFFSGVKFLDELKLRASFGRVGNANPGYYLYQQTYVGGDPYFFGSGVTSTVTIHENDLASIGRVSEKADKLNIGLDMAFSNQRGWLTVDYYNNRQFGLLQAAGRNSALLGQVFPLLNLGINRYYGFEVSTGWSDNIGKLHYSISGNLSTVGSKILYNDEPDMPYAYMRKTGGPVNQITGYVYDGLFNSSNLTAPTMSGFTPQPGDAKYKDLNNDGVINQYDQTIIGNKKPLVLYGANLSLQYMGFDLNVLLQGVANHDIQVNGTYEFPFNGANGKGQAYEYNMARYTPQTAATATLPRVTLGTDNNNYIAASSLFVRNDNYLRLKNAEIGYSFNARFLSAIKVKRIRVFVNGQNLLTSSKYKESDPEDYTGLYPLARIINGGISVKL